MTPLGRRFTICVLALMLLLGCSSRMGRELVLAASEGDVGRVRAVLSQGAAVDYKLPDNGTTALIAAARNGHLAVVEILLTSGADINEIDHDVGTALYWAAFNGQVNTMKFLIAKGGKMNCSSASAAYLLNILRQRNVAEAESMARAQLQREGIAVESR
jgi:ankyrin repeat protein